MCGIVGYIGKRKALPILLNGLKRLEYRGYDSAGVITLDQKNFFIEKEVGKIKNLEEKINKEFGEVDRIDGNVGIAHTRWATHGESSVKNAHPHKDCSGKFWLVHNGIIENYNELKSFLEKRGHKFISDTDTEVLAHLVEENYQGNLLKALETALKKVEGTYGIVLVSKNEPDKLIVARKGSPLLIGVGKDEIIVASDVSAIISYTDKVVYLNDGEIAEIKKDNFKIFNNIKKEEVAKKINKITWDIKEIEKSGFDHFMLKEIFEQKEVFLNAIKGRLLFSEGKAKLGGLDLVADKIRKIKRLIIIGCGSAYNAGVVGEYLIENLAGIPVELEYASEFRYRNSVLEDGVAILAISQSGETADTLAAIREAKEKGVLTLGIVNVVGSTISREVDAGIYNHAGPEISVASTKVFMSQVAVLVLMALYLGRQRKMSLSQGREIIDELQNLPKKIDKVLTLNDEIKKIAQKYFSMKNFAFLGRTYNEPLAFEGALKLKELSYIHAEGFPSGEMKHGPIAMIDKNFPCFFIAPNDSVFKKNLSNMEEIKSRQGKIIAISNKKDKKLEKIIDDLIIIPKTKEYLNPILALIPLQLFAYHMAVLNKKDVDKPRNLAKSVTVE